MLLHNLRKIQVHSIGAVVSGFLMMRLAAGANGFLMRTEDPIWLLGASILVMGLFWMSIAEIVKLFLSETR